MGEGIVGALCRQRYYEAYRTVRLAHALIEGERPRPKPARSVRLTAFLSQPTVRAWLETNGIDPDLVYDLATLIYLLPEPPVFVARLWEPKAAARGEWSPREHVFPDFPLGWN